MKTADRGDERDASLFLNCPVSIGHGNGDCNGGGRKAEAVTRAAAALVRPYNAVRLDDDAPLPSSDDVENAKTDSGNNRFRRKTTRRHEFCIAFLPH